MPPGARISLDGEKLGVSDGLFFVSPGMHKVELELDGYTSEIRQVSVPAGQIKRLEVKFTDQLNSASGGASRDTTAYAKTATAYIEAHTDIPEATRSAMLTVLRQHPTEYRWSGRRGPTVFAMAVKMLPSGASQHRAVPALLNLTHSLAVHELLKANSLLNKYGVKGLTDATTLCQAMVEAAGRLDITGSVKAITHQSAVQGNFVVGYVIAEEQNLTAHLLQDTELEKVKTAYRNVMHRQARGLMKRKYWKDAILLWRHLHKRKLVSQALYLDAARCFKALGQNEDTIHVLAEAIETFSATATADFFEQAGDIALSIDTDAAQLLAQKAYDSASERLLDTISRPTDLSEENNQSGPDQK